mmetsp:Transcript_286/g.790  ORF Transcript_286/g.790 Transcript_286/m.790 type:complete len:352 (+) Transcript_286:88-1143(+)
MLAGDATSQTSARYSPFDERREAVESDEEDGGDTGHFVEGIPWEDDPNSPSSVHVAEASLCFMVIYFVCVLAMVVATVVVIAPHWGTCDQPLQVWSVVHVCRHCVKWLLYMDRGRVLRALGPSAVPDALKTRIKVLETVALAWWAFGLYWLTHCKECDHHVYQLASALFALQSLFLAAPCLLLLLLLMCLPVLVWVVPYLIPGNPNQTGTPSDVLSRARTGTIAALRDAAGALWSEYGDVDALKECSICLSHMEDEQIAMQLPCHPQHIFHIRCIERWLQNSQLCPICRSNVAHLLAPETAPAPEELAANVSGHPLLETGGQGTDDLELSIRPLAVPGILEPDMNTANQIA